MEDLIAGLNIIGLCFEIFGIYLMANVYMRTYNDRYSQPMQVIRVMGSSLVGGRLAKAVEGIATILKEDLMTSLRGLTLIGIGFLLQVVANVLVVLN